jgi:hypothetical protein
MKKSIILPILCTLPLIVYDIRADFASKIANIGGGLAKLGSGIANSSVVQKFAKSQTGQTVQLIGSVALNSVTGAIQQQGNDAMAWLVKNALVPVKNNALAVQQRLQQELNNNLDPDTRAKYLEAFSDTTQLINEITAIEALGAVSIADLQRIMNNISFFSGKIHTTLSQTAMATLDVTLASSIQSANNQLSASLQQQATTTPSVTTQQIQPVQYQLQPAVYQQPQQAVVYQPAIQ